MPKIFMRLILISLCAFLSLARIWAAEPPREFVLKDLEISIEEQPRWPSGYAMKVTVHRGSITVAKTVLPCDPCQTREETRQVSDVELLDLLNRFCQLGFFEARAEYSSTRSYVLGADGVIRETQTVTTDENRVTLRVRLGDWSKQVVDDGEAPVNIRELQDTMFTIARAKRQ
jgi:hypothetical protein